MHSPLFSSALQNRLTAGLCHCNQAYGELLFIQVCSEPSKMHCNTGLGKMHFPLFSGALQKRNCMKTFLGLQSVSEATQKQPAGFCSALLPTIPDRHDRPSRHIAVFRAPLPRGRLQARSITDFVTSWRDEFLLVSNTVHLYLMNFYLETKLSTYKQICPPVLDECLLASRAVYL